jgi:hypothetical protein
MTTDTPPGARRARHLVEASADRRAPSVRVPAALVAEDPAGDGGVRPAARHRQGRRVRRDQQRPRQVTPRDPQHRR